MALLACLPCRTAGDVIISEFMATNSGVLADEDGDYSDWIELYNTGSTVADLTGWFLTDDALDLRKWKFPEASIPPGEALVVFASNKNRNNPAAPLHTNFKLTGDGEYLALVKSDGLTIASDFAPQFPPQVPDVSFGVAMALQDQTLIGDDAPVRYNVPTTDLPPELWTAVGFDDTAWGVGQNGIGYVAPAQTAREVAYERTMLKLNPIGFWHFDETSGLRGTNLGTLGTALDLAYTSITLNQPGPRPTQFQGFQTTNVCAKFDGIKSQASPGTNVLNNLSGFSMCGWIKQTTKLSRAGLWGQNHAITLGFDTPTTLELATANGGSVHADYNFPTTEWHFVAATGDGENLRVYIDGMLAIEGGDPAPNYGASNFNFAIGQGVFDSFENGLIGLMDEVALFDRSLSSDEVFLLYLAGTNPARNYGELIKTDVSAVARNVSSSLYARIPFLIDGSANFNFLTLNLNYDDGYAIFLNGVEVARQNAPETPVFDSRATASRPGAAGLQPQEINLSASTGLLQPGTNVLAIHLMNASSDDEDLLLKANLTASVAVLTPEKNALRYFTAPTPGRVNGFGSTNLGPLVLNAKFSPDPPTDNDDISVTARIRPTFDPVAEVKLTYKVMFGAEVTIPMLDDGSHNDGVAGDGIFGAFIPASASTNGQMVRWFITAVDATGDTNRWPSYLDKKNSPQYFGTMVSDPGVQSPLPVVYWFVQNTTAAETSTGARCSIYYNGKFYDNVFAGVHGQSSLEFPKKSFNINFNTGYHFEYEKGKPLVDRFNLLTTYPDKAQMRNLLAYETFRDAGSPYHLAFPVRVQRNGAFFSIAHYVEDGEASFLERIGRDPRGALYKMYSTFDSATSNVEKKTRKFEGNTDLQNLLNGVRLSGTARAAYIYDNLNVPEIVDYLAALIITANVDCCHKNYYFYRDSEQSGEWEMFPWDVDLSFGRDWTGTLTYYDDHMYYDNPLDIGSGNTLVAAMFGVPAIKQMYYRRIRTLMDELLQPKSTPPEELKYEKRIGEIQTLLTPDFPLDYQKWLLKYPWGQAPNRTQTLSQAVSLLVTNFMPKRRDYLYVTQKSAIPSGQPTNATILFSGFEFNPSTGNQQHEYLSLTNTNSIAIDLSGWRLDGGVQFTFEPGTVLPPKGKVYLSPNRVAFRSRPISPKGKEGLFVRGNYKGQLSARGETIVLYDKAGQVIDTLTYPGQPTLAQQFLRVVEIMYAPPTTPQGSLFGTEEFEYIALKNIGGASLDLNGVNFSNGISFIFSSSSPISLAPGEVIYVAKNPDAFRSRYGSGPRVFGPFNGQLGNGGEAVDLRDSVGENVLNFQFQTWFPSTDSQGYSLVIRDEKGDYAKWGEKDSWQPGPLRLGSPAVDNWDLWSANYFDPAELENPAISGPNADPDGDGFNNQIEFLAGTNPRDASSVLALHLDFDPSGNPVLHLRAAAGKSYSVLISDSLEKLAWRKLQDIDPSVAGNDIALPITGGASGFFRVVTPALK